MKSDKTDRVSRHLNGNKLDNIITNLKRGTDFENYLDREKHGTVLRGDFAPWTKLPESIAREIIRRKLSGEKFSLKQFSDKNNVSYQSVKDVACGKWKWLWIEMRKNKNDDRYVKGDIKNGK